MKVYFETLGCPKNFNDTQAAKGVLIDAGYEIADSAENSDVIVVNTCGFINDAKKESIEKIFDMAEYCGEHVVITEKRKIHDGTYRYGIEGSRYNWTESMFAESEADKTVRTQRLLKLLVKEREEVEREIINWQGLLASDMAKLEKIEADIERLNKELNGE